MIRSTSRYLVPFVLGAIAVSMAFSLGFLAGCSREEAPGKPPVTADPPSVYMKDPAFRAALKEKDVARKKLLVAREKLFEEMEKRVDAMRSKMTGADDAAVKKELEKDPEWNSLMKRIKDLNEAYNDNRKAATKIVAERIAPKKSGKSRK